MTAPLFFSISLGRVREHTRDGDGPYTEIQLYDRRLPNPAHQAAPAPLLLPNPVESAS